MTMGMVFVVRTVGEALDVLRTWAKDGDTIQLVGPRAGVYPKLEVESTAIGLGLDVVVELPDRATDRVTGSGDV